MKLAIIGFITASLVSFPKSAVYAESEHQPGISGIVIDETPDYSPEMLEKLKNSVTGEAPEAFMLVLQDMHVPAPLPGAMVELKGKDLSRQIKTDTEGRFLFKDLPTGLYEISVVSPTAQSVLNNPYRVEFSGKNRDIKLPLRNDLVTIKGRITDPKGQPIAGAKVRGEPTPSHESTDVMKFYPTRTAISNPDGYYELNGFVPRDIQTVAGYLNGGNPVAEGYPFYVALHAESEGYIQPRETVPQVPLVTEQLLHSARIFLNILHSAGQKGNPGSKKKARPDLPTSQGNIINGIDIILQNDKS